MVKFGKHLEEEGVPEWKDQYVNYKKLKKLIKKLHRLMLADPTRAPTTIGVSLSTPAPTNAAAMPLEYDDSVRDSLARAYPRKVLTEWSRETHRMTRAAATWGSPATRQ